MILEGVYDMIFSFAEVEAKLYYRIMKQIYSKYIWNIEKKIKMKQFLLSKLSNRLKMLKLFLVTQTSYTYYLNTNCYFTAG